VSVGFAILRCLGVKPTHGYRLQQILTSLVHFYPLRNVNVYLALRELEEEGRVKSSTELVGSRARKVYTITDQGRADFEEWLRSPPEMHLPETRDPVLLRLVLTTGSGNDLDWLDESTAALSAEIERATARYEKAHASMGPIAHLAARELIDSLRRRRAFLESARELNAATNATG
jgi:DNA-binding PadR family transcriptional regulator